MPGLNLKSNKVSFEEDRTRGVFIKLSTSCCYVVYVVLQ